MEEILTIYQGYLAQVGPDNAVWVAYSDIVNLLQSGESVLYIKNALHAHELLSSTSEIQVIYQAARYRVERILWPH